MGFPKRVESSVCDEVERIVSECLDRMRRSRGDDEGVLFCAHVGKTQIHGVVFGAVHVLLELGECRPDVDGASDAIEEAEHDAIRRINVARAELLGELAQRLPLPEVREIFGFGA